VTTFVLIRHAAHDLVGYVLAGRKLDVPLNDQGRRQAADVAWQLAVEPIARVIASPRRRARETAAPICAAVELPLLVAPQIDEHDAGQWAGRSFSELDQDPRWRLWNARRGAARPPGGESMLELQQRVVDYLDGLAARYPKDVVVLVSHAEPIRAALMHARGIALDDFLTVDVPVASIARLECKAENRRRPYAAIGAA
jgi:broad specificity phosphatase PhoE